MKAAQIATYGDSSVIQVVDVDTPVVQRGKVLVEVYAASLNPFDSTIRAGYMQEMIPLQLPVTLGGDIAGVVAEVGEGVINVAVGDKIYGQANVVAGNSGAFAEYAVTSAGQLTQLPEGLDFQQAASLPLVGVSALQALTDYLNLVAGRILFIHGGGGGIGTIAIQIAKNIGAYVATTATDENIDLVKRLGADEVIDYKAQDFTEILNEYDAVFDTVGGDDFTKSLAVLKTGGIAVSMIAEADAAKASELGVTAITQSTQVNTERLNELKKLIETGVITPRIGKVFPLDQVKVAFDARESGTVEGKIILTIR